VRFPQRRLRWEVAICFSCVAPTFCEMQDTPCLPAAVTISLAFPNKTLRFWLFLKGLSLGRVLRKDVTASYTRSKHRTTELPSLSLGQVVYSTGYQPSSHMEIPTTTWKGRSFPHCIVQCLHRNHFFVWLGVYPGPVLCGWGSILDLPYTTVGLRWAFCQLSSPVCRTQCCDEEVFSRITCVLQDGSK
jgi:hypothetical protein